MVKGLFFELYKMSGSGDSPTSVLSEESSEAPARSLKRTYAMLDVESGGPLSKVNPVFLGGKNCRRSLAPTIIFF